MRKVISRSLPFWMGACALMASFVAVNAQPPQKQKKTSGLLVSYSVLAIEKFTVQSKAIDAGFSSDQSAQLQKDLAAKLREKKLFAEVVVVSDAISSANGSTSRIVISGEITEFKPGSVAKRSLDGGAGLGHATLTAHFVFRDAVSGKQILALNEKTRYYGGDPLVDNEHLAISHLCDEMVNALIRDIAKNQ
jgi:hypothetical protein